MPNKLGTPNTLGHLADSTLDMMTIGPEQPRVLKPYNGFSSNKIAYDPYGNVVAVDEHSSSPAWWAKWLTLVRAAVDLQGGDIHAADKLLSWVQRNPAFEGAVYKEFFLPVVPPSRTGRETEREISIEEGQKENCLVG
jgi:hypothetical protein